MENILGLHGTKQKVDVAPKISKQTDTNADLAAAPSKQTVKASTRMIYGNAITTILLVIVIVLFTTVLLFSFSNVRILSRQNAFVSSVIDSLSPFNCSIV